MIQHRKISSLPPRCRKLPAAVAAHAVMVCRSGSHRGAAACRSVVLVPAGSRSGAETAGAAQAPGACPALVGPVHAVVRHMQSRRHAAAAARARLANHVYGIGTASQTARERCRAGSACGARTARTSFVRHQDGMTHSMAGISDVPSERRTVYADSPEWVVGRKLRAKRQWCIL